MENEKSSFNNNQEDQIKSQKLPQKLPYKSPTLIQYGTVAKLTQGTRSRGKETRRRKA